MPSIEITAYQEVHYNKVVELEQAEYDVFMALESDDDRQQWLTDSDSNFNENDINDYGPIEEFTIKAL